MLQIFETIKEKQSVKGICSVCNKRKSRIVIIEQTVNPFNQNEDGTVKNRQQVYQAVSEKLSKKVRELSENFICASCKKYI